MIRRTVVAVVALLVPLAAAAEVEAEAPSGNLLITPQFGLVFWTAITFGILLVLLRLVAWKPLIGAMEVRERGIREALEQARKDREDTAALMKEHRELVAQARRERAEVLAQGQRDAEVVKAEILAQAKHQREELLKQAEGQIEASLRQARAELRAATADMVIAATEKLLARNLDDATQRKLVEDHLADLEHSRAGSAVSS